MKFAGDKTNEVGNDTYRVDWNTYYNYTQIVSNYKAYTNDNKAELKNTVNALEPAGATSADYAMDHAKTLVKQSKIDEATNPNRKNVKRIVIFFTDGEPTYGRSFDSSVANKAIQTAKEIKADAKMYRCKRESRKAAKIDHHQKRRQITISRLFYVPMF